MRPIRTLKAAIIGTCSMVLLSACEFSVYDIPLPGGADAGDDPMTVTIEFADVLDLVPQSSVKVNDVSVGTVTDIALDDYHAEVTVELPEDVELPADARAEIRQTSLLGEKFVSLTDPSEGGTQDPLQDGDRIPLDRSGRNPEVEEVLGALSLLLNGGGIAQMQTIAQEVNQALEGREGSARSVLRQLDGFMGELDSNKGDIVRAIRSLNRLSQSVNAQIDTIDATLTEMPSALRSIDRQREDLVEMLQALDELGDVGVEVIQASKEGTLESLRRLDPVLTNLADTGDDFANAFHVFLTYPFVDEVVGRDPQVARNLHMGDYTNLSVQLDIDLSTLGLPQGPVVDEVEECLDGGDLTGPECLGLPGDVLEDVCDILPSNPVCQGLSQALAGLGLDSSPEGQAGLVQNLVRGLGLGGLQQGGPQSGGGSGGGPGGGSGSGSGGGSGDGSGDGLLGGLLGLNRAPFGDAARPGADAALPEGHDSDLARLLVPGGSR